MLDDLSTGERAPGVFEKRLPLPGRLLERRELPANERQIQRSEHLELFDTNFLLRPKLLQLSSAHPFKALPLKILPRVIERSRVEVEGARYTEVRSSQAMPAVASGEIPVDKYRKTREAISKLTPEQYSVTQQSATERPGP